MLPAENSPVGRPTVKPVATATTSRQPLLRAIIMALAALALILGLYGGLGRLGFPVAAQLAMLHGPLLICGLFGTLIGLERAVAMGGRWMLGAPLASGLGTLALLVGVPPAVGAAAYAVSAAVLTAGCFLITLRQPALFTGALIFGALTWLVGNLLWMTGSSIPDVAGWWLAFLVLTVAAERLELSRLLPPMRGSEAHFLFSLGLILAGAQNGLLSDDGSILSGLALLCLTAWLLRHDIARFGIRQRGQVRFMAACMLAAYIWLAAAAAALLLSAPAQTALGYDIALHAILIGFVISMVFGHALIILPAVLSLRVAYTPTLYLALGLLHVSVLLRIGSGLAEWAAGRLASGVLTLAALLLFAGLLALSDKARRRPLQLRSN